MGAKVLAWRAVVRETQVVCVHGEPPAALLVPTSHAPRLTDRIG